MNYNNLKVIGVLVALIPTLLFAQGNTFTNFKTTKSVGKPPAVFTTSFKDKVSERIGTSTEIDEENREHFASYTNYSLNKLLSSGFVLYGDPMTQFVNKVASKLLENEPALKRKLQFYVIKTNTTNALCTDPGLIFITTGLISQIENEAQLAYIIAHEIVHYQEKHHQKSFVKSKESELDPSSYDDMVLLSKDHEFEADANALKLYHAAGYSDHDINVVFDVLMYSYLSFDEINLDSTFFNNPNVFIPSSIFPEAANPILAFEDYDDSKSTHPNIRKRRDAIAGEIKKYSNWGTTKNYIDLEEFKTIQNIARFESVRENVLTSNYLKALYEIFILENEFPDNEYLQTFKALAWANINQVSLKGRLRTITKETDKIEGQLSILYGIIKKLSKEDLALLTIRQIEDVYQKFPESKRIQDIRKESIENLTLLRNFKIENLENISFFEAQILLEEQLNDTLPKKEEVGPENETKYDRIKRIREQQRTDGIETSIEEENFSKYIIYDLVNDSTFNQIYQAERDRIEASKKLDFEDEKSKKLEGDIILITPRLKAEVEGDFDLESTLLFYEYFESGVQRYAPQDKIKIRDITKVENFTTENYNEVCTLISYVIQASHLDERNFNNLMVDYEEMKSLIAKYDNPYLLLVSGEYYFNKATDKAVTGEATYIELATGKIYNVRKYITKYKLKKAPVEGLAHLVFSRFN